MSVERPIPPIPVDAADTLQVVREARARFSPGVPAPSQQIEHSLGHLRARTSQLLRQG
jgi:hypothetical protein